MPWIFLCLMLANAVYFGWKFMEGTQPQVKPVAIAQAPAGKRVELLSEKPELLRPSPETISAEEKPVEAPIASTTTANGPQCFDVGPFTADASLQKFVGLMQENHFFVRVDKRKTDGKDYWVFIPAFTNRARAEEKLRELKVHGIEGFVVKDGAFINAISLNHFSRKDLAQSFLQKMQSDGITVEYREISQPGVEHWVYLAPSQSKADLRGTIDAQLVKQEGLKRENAACEE